jgi:LPS-assembly protein
MDIHPRLTLRLPAVYGFSIIPSVGIRETYYGSQLSDDSDTGVLNRGLRRHYSDIIVDMKTPLLEKYYDESWAGTFRHTIEPYATYRWIEGVDDLDSIIRFDENDAVADTNEIEYGIVNRLFTYSKNGAGIPTPHEFMTIALMQKYYFDPSFGGTFIPGHANSFYPMNTITGFYQTGIERVFSPLSAIIRIRTKSGMDHDLRADYDTSLHRWRNTSVSTGWRQGKFRLAGTYFRALQTEPEMFSANQLKGRIEYGTPTSGFASSLAISYNFQTDRLLNSRTRLSYAWNCCSITTEFKQYALGLRTETEFSFSFWLKGIGSLGNMQTSNSLF